MPIQPPQSLQNYTRWDPLFHFVLMPILLANVILRVYELVHVLNNGGTGDLLRAGWAIILAFALVLLAFKARLFALKAQDRVIRLEERLRMTAILPEPMRARIGEVTEAQMIALRFASDDDLTELARAALDKQLSPKDIKQSIRHWRPDYFRV